jgi:hypothetical protein
MISRVTQIVLASVVLVVLGSLLVLWQMRPIDPSPPSVGVAFWGDSLTEGYPHPLFANDGSNSLPGAFRTIYPSGPVYNGGKSGETAEEIAIRQGGLSLTVSVDGGVIPATGSVTVKTTDPIGWQLQRIWSCEGTLDGVEGTLSRESSALTFRRKTAGPAMPLDSPVAFISAPGQDHRQDVQVIIAGRNDVGLASPAGEPVDRIVEANTDMVKFLPDQRHVLICGTITATVEGRGTPGYVTVTTANDALRRLYPSEFWDFRGWLVHDALYALGITPTPEDKAAMAADTVPPSLMVPGDPIHYSPAVAAAAAVQIKDELDRRGWVS